MSSQHEARGLADRAEGIAAEKDHSEWFLRQEAVLAEARTLLPALADEIDRLTAEVARYEGRVAQVVGERLAVLQERWETAERRLKTLEYICDTKLPSTHVSTSGTVCFCWRCQVDQVSGKTKPASTEVEAGTPLIRIGGTGSMHPIGDAKCHKCASGHPVVHEGCGGLLHGGYGEEMAVGDYWLYIICDVCGGSGR